MSTQTRREFLQEFLALGTVATMSPLLLGSSCSPTPAPYFPPSGLARAFNGPVLHLKAVSPHPNRIDLFFVANSQLHHKWLEVTSPGVHRWGPDETSVGEPLGAFEFPAPVAADGKMMLFAVAGGAASFRVFDPATGWAGWVSLPGANVPKVLAYDHAAGTNQVVGLDNTRQIVAAQVSRVFNTPTAWQVIRSYPGGGQHEWLDAVALPNSGGAVLFGRMNTGALVYMFGNSGVWQEVASAPGIPSLAATAHYENNWLTPVFFTNVSDGAGNESFRFIWRDTSGDRQIDLGPHVNPPVVISQSPSSDFYRQELDLFTAARSGADSGRTALQWAHVTVGDLTEGRIRWETLASNLSLGGEQITPISWGNGRLDVFVTDVGGNVWHKWKDSRTTLGWQPAA